MLCFPGGRSRAGGAFRPNPRPQKGSHPRNPLRTRDARRVGARARTRTPSSKPPWRLGRRAREDCRTRICLRSSPAALDANLRRTTDFHDTRQALTGQLSDNLNGTASYTHRWDENRRHCTCLALFSLLFQDWDTPFHSHLLIILLGNYMISISFSVDRMLEITRRSHLDWANQAE